MYVCVCVCVCVCLLLCNTGTWRKLIVAWILDAALWEQ